MSAFSSAPAQAALHEPDARSAERGGRGEAAAPQEADRRVRHLRPAWAERFAFVYGAVAAGAMVLALETADVLLAAGCLA